MLSKAVASVILFSAMVTVSGRSSASIDPAAAAAFSSIYQSLYKVDYKTKGEAKATQLAAAPAIQALFSTVPGISTKNVGADLASAWDELFTQTGGPNAGLVTGSAIQYINSIPTNGPAANLLQTGFQAVYKSVSAKDPVYVSQALVGAGLGSLASGLARETGASGNGTKASGAAESTGAADTRSRASDSASSTSAPTMTAAPTSDQANTGSSNTPQASTTQPQQAAATSNSTAGVASQPTAIIMAAGAAAAGVLGFAALL